MDQNSHEKITRFHNASPHEKHTMIINGILDKIDIQRKDIDNLKERIENFEKKSKTS